MREERKNSRPLLAWLLLRWWLVFVPILIGAVAGFLIGGRTSAVYQARSVVVVSKAEIPAEDIGALAQSAFTTSTVLQPVITMLGLRETPHSLLASGTLQAQSVRGTGALEITASSPNPGLPVKLANAAAESFASNAAAKGLGTFAVFEAGDPPVLVRPSAVKSALFGGLAGAVVGMALLILEFFVRDPILDQAEAVRELPAEAVFSARVKPPQRSFLGRKPATRPEIFPPGLVPAILREADGTGPPLCVLVGSPGKAHRRAQVLVQEMNTHRQALGDAGAGSEPVILVSSRDTTLLASVGFTQAVIALTSVGVRRQALRQLEEELSLARGTNPRVLVFMK